VDGMIPAMELSQNIIWHAFGPELGIHYDLAKHLAVFQMLMGEAQIL
jgi:hypothetical protein